MDYVMTRDEIDRLVLTYINLTNAMADKVNDSSDPDYIYWTGAACYFAGAMSGQVIARLVQANLNHPSPAVRLWAWDSLNKYAEMQLKFLRDDKTMWN